MKVTRTLMSFVVLPEYNSAQERITTTHADIKDAVDKIRQNIQLYSERYLHLGWALDPDGWSFDVEGLRVLGKGIIWRDE